MSSERPTIYLDGWRASVLGVTSRENPYDPRTQRTSHEQWLLGWSDWYREHRGRWI